MIIGWKSSPAIHAGLQTNRLRIVRSGDSIALYANDQYIGGTKDGSSSGGRGLLGLWVDAYSPGFDGRFDNFAVYTNTCNSAGSTAAGRNIMSVGSGD